MVAEISGTARPSEAPLAKRTRMATKTGRPSRAKKPRVPISTLELLAAVAELAATWTDRFSEHEIVDVIEAVDREQLAGNLLDGATVSLQGQHLVNAPGWRFSDDEAADGSGFWPVRVSP